MGPPQSSETVGMEHIETAAKPDVPSQHESVDEDAEVPPSRRKRLMAACLCLLGEKAVFGVGQSLLF